MTRILHWNEEPNLPSHWSLASVSMLDWIVYVYLFSMPFQEASVMPLLAGTLVKYLGIAALLMCMANIVKQQRLHVNRPIIWLVLFASWVFLSAIWSISPVTSRVVLVGLAGYLLVAVAIAMVPQTPAQVSRLRWAIALGGVVAATIVLTQPRTGMLARATLAGIVTTSDPNDFAASLLPPLAVLAGEVGMKWPVRVALCALIVAAVLSTGSRGGTLATLMVLVVSLAWHRRGKALIWAVIGTLAMAGVLWLAVVRLFPALLVRLSVQEIQAGRWYIWPTGLKAWARFGLSGAGIGAFPAAYDMVGASAAGYSRAAHNIFLQIGVELGVPGVILLFATLWSSFKRVRLDRVAVSALLGVLVAGFFLGVLQASFFWVVIVFPMASSAEVAGPPIAPVLMTPAQSRLRPQRGTG